jgi:cation diffusion facilitator family transporter
MQIAQENFKIQTYILGIGVFLFVLKFSAWYLTKSVAVLSDALEGVINIITGLLGLYALYLATIPSDKNHPYGHGKAEFITAGAEGVMISLAGIAIAYKGVMSFIRPETLQNLDWGILLVALAGLVNFGLGWYGAVKGKANRSPALESTGKHLLSDAYTTIGVTISLVVVYFTKAYWIDGVVSFVLAILLIYMGYKIIRKALGGVMDETDVKLVQEIKDVLAHNKQPDWLAFENIRVIKSGSLIHIDGIIVLPKGMTVEQAQQKLGDIQNLMTQHFGEETETAFVVHAG